MTSLPSLPAEPPATESPDQLPNETPEKNDKREKRKRKKEKERDRSRAESKEEQGTTQGKPAEEKPRKTQPVTGKGSSPGSGTHIPKSVSCFDLPRKPRVVFKRL